MIYGIWYSYLLTELNAMLLIVLLRHRLSQPLVAFPVVAHCHLYSNSALGTNEVVRVVEIGGRE